MADEIQKIVEDVYELVFCRLDIEPNYSGMEAGFVATLAQATTRTALDLLAANHSTGEENA